MDEVVAHLHDALREREVLRVQVPGRQIRIEVDLRRARDGRVQLPRDELVHADEVGGRVLCDGREGDVRNTARLGDIDQVDDSGLLLRQPSRVVGAVESVADELHHDDLGMKLVEQPLKSSRPVHALQDSGRSGPVDGAVDGPDEGRVHETGHGGHVLARGPDPAGFVRVVENDGLGVQERRGEKKRG